MVSMENGDDQSPNLSKINKYSVACAVVASMISIIFGYDTGVMSGAMIFIKEDLLINDTQVSVLAGILNVCALFGSLAAGRTSDYIGRRYTICLASVIFLLGSVLMGYGPNYALLMTGRCTAGIGVGFALMVAPVYSAEISSPKTRGFLSSLPELCISIGVLTGYISNFIFGKMTLKIGWRLMLGIAAIPSLILAVGILKMPESPRWLILQGRLKDARDVLLQVSNTPEEADQRFCEIKIAAGIVDDGSCDVVKVSDNCKGHGVWKELLVHPTYAVRRILLAAVGIHFFQHATGIEAVILYSPRIFRMAGVHKKSKLLLATIGVGVTKVIFIITSTFLLDRTGRRKLLLVSLSGMFVALVLLGTGLTIVQHASHEMLWALALCIGSTYLFVAFFAIGLCPVTWVYASEIFPLKLRAQGAGIGVAVNRMINALVSISFIPLYKAITIGGSFFFFAGMSVLALVFFYFFCPETKGVNLEDMELLFRDGRKAWKEHSNKSKLELHTISKA
uniref:Major facilitator superfamily (MFS) profile domain-containing protein n=1 Tax=Kalanchoe fedtschenkoi TaxID=63787 RepID=A0A7N1A8K2_KALFE